MLKYKLAEDGKSILIDDKGLPIVVNEKGEEFGLDALHLHSKVPTLNNEAKEYREKLEAALETVKKFDGIEDPAAAVQALEKIKSLDEKQMMDIGEVEKLKASLLKVEHEKMEEIKTAFSNQIEDLKATITNQESDIFKAMVSSRFSRSDYFTGGEPKTSLHPDIAEAYFGKNFKVERKDGVAKVVGYFDNGEKIFSKEKPGELAGFDEALGEVINKSPHKESIMMPSIGSGATGGALGAKTSQTIKDLPASERLKAIHGKTAA